MQEIKTFDCIEMLEPKEELLHIQEVLAKEKIDLFYQIAPMYGLDPTVRSPWGTKMVYPSPKRYEVPPEILDIVGVKEDDRRPLPHIPIIEVMGLPDSGKSTLCNHLQGIYPKALIKDEFTGTGKFPSSGDVDIDNLSLTMQKQLSIIPSLLQQLEIKKRELSQENIKIDSPAIFTRGTNDILAFSIPFYLSMLEEDDIFDPVSSYFIEELIHQLSFIDVVVLFDNDLDTASLRRVRSGKDRYGKIVNPNIWPIIERGYSWWLQYVYPILRERYGTGLLVLDGRNHYKENNRSVVKYIKKVLRNIPTY